MKKIIKYIINVWNIKELRNKIIVTLFLLFIYRLGSYIPLAGINNDYIHFFIYKNNRSKNIIQIISYFTGDAFNRASIFSLGIMPYISSSIIMQLMSMTIPVVQKIYKEGEIGKKKIDLYTKYMTIFICFIQAPIYVNILIKKFLPLYIIPKAYLFNIYNDLYRNIFIITSVILLTIGTILSIWIGELISSIGIGNGISLIMLTGIIVKFPKSFVEEILNKIKINYNYSFYILSIEYILWLLIISFIILITQSIRKIPIQYVGHSKFDIINKNNNRQYIPIKLIPSGVMPIIFSQSIMLIPVFISFFIKNNKYLNIIKNIENIHGLYYNIIICILIIIFNFFYISISMPVNQISDDLKRNGGLIFGVKPGKETSKYLKNILFNITFPGGLILSIIFILPSIFIRFGITNNLSFFYGGTSLLILVNVLLDTYQKINLYILNNKYDNLIKNQFI